VAEERADPWDDGRSTGPVRVSLADAERNAKAFFKKQQAKQAAQQAHAEARRRRPHQAEYGPSRA
jgi:hypothetical protein